MKNLVFVAFEFPGIKVLSRTIAKYFKLPLTYIYLII